MHRPLHGVAATSRDRIVLVAALLGLLACGPREGSQPSDRPPPALESPPLVLVSLDTLRADHLSVYGYARATSPHLERFAEEAVTFERFYYSGGGTLPSHMTLMTSLNPVTHGLHPPDSDENVLHPSRWTLAEVLREAGYATAAFTDGGWMRAKFGFDQGFDTYDHEGHRFAEILPKAIDWLDAHHRTPFFLFVHSYDIHSEWDKLPYACPEPFVHHFSRAMELSFDGCRGELCASRLFVALNRRLRAREILPEEALNEADLAYVRALYDGCIRYADDRVHALFTRLRELGIYDQSLIVVLSDHGEEFLEHGMLLHDQGGYEEIARIPLLIKLPGGALAGRRVTGLASMVDVMPTLLELLSLEVPEQAQGWSLVPLMRDDRPVQSVTHMYDTLATEEWKLLKGPGELYDLRDDPGEITNLHARQPAVVAELTSQLERLIRRDRAARQDFDQEAASHVDRVELSPEEREQLRALGYLE